MTAYNQFRLDFYKDFVVTKEQCFLSNLTVSPEQTRQYKQDNFDGRIYNGHYQTKNK